MSWWAERYPILRPLIDRTPGSRQAIAVTIEDMLNQPEWSRPEANVDEYHALEALKKFLERCDG